MPSSLLESIADFLSRIANIDAAESFALAESGAMPADWETPNAAIVNAKKTCKELAFRTETKSLSYEKEEEKGKEQLVLYLENLSKCCFAMFSKDRTNVETECV